MKLVRNWASGLILVSMMLVLVTGASASATFPVAERAVNDYAELLTAAELAQLEAISQELLNQTGAALVVAIVDTIGDRVLEDYATDLFAEWGIGDEDKDNGVLILLAMSERALAIEVGYGVEDVMTDARSGAILRDLMLPALGKGDYAEGLDRGMRAIATVIASKYEVTLEEGGGFNIMQLDQRADGHQRDIGGIILMMVVGVGLIALGTAKFGRKCPRCKSRLHVTDRIIKQATTLDGGRACKTYTCPRCGYRDEKTYNTPPLSRTHLGGPMIGRGGRTFGGGSRGGFGGFGGGRSGGGGARGRF